MVKLKKINRGNGRNRIAREAYAGDDTKKTT